MTETADIGSIAQIIANGGVVALCCIVWWELREQRRERRAHAQEHTEILVAIRESMSALLERDRERRPTPIEGVPISRAPTRYHQKRPKTPPPEDE